MSLITQLLFKGGKLTSLLILFWPVTSIGGESLRVDKLILGPELSCVLFENSARAPSYCWGAMQGGYEPKRDLKKKEIQKVFPEKLQKNGIENIESISVARDPRTKEQHICMVFNGGKVGCWGDSSFGVLGKAQVTKEKLGFSIVPGIEQAVEVETSVRNSCALLKTGRVLCWGARLGPRFFSAFKPREDEKHLDANGDGQVSDEDAMRIYHQHEGPFQSAKYVPFLENIQTFAMSPVSSHACFVTERGQVYCLGPNRYGELGRPSKKKERKGGMRGSSLPLRIPGVEQAKEVAVGSRHHCALLEDGGVKCWGSHATQQLGHSVAGGYSPQPQLVEGIEAAKEVVVSRPLKRYPQEQVPAVSCARSQEKRIKCWGSTNLGVLNGVQGDKKSLAQPHELPGMERVTELALGSSRACAAISKGQNVVCWGEDQENNPAMSYREKIRSKRRLSEAPSRAPASKGTTPKRVNSEFQFLSLKTR